ncbi:MAG TPA: hypothetical protein G4N92_00445 [Anaerolineae bacterium]|nr:hypothetical protein [Anaerolineae bacterium]
MNRNRAVKREKRRLSQENATSWDVTVLSFRLVFQRIQFWIQPNIWFVLLSIPVLTSPGAKAAMTYTISKGLRDPGGSRVNPHKAMKKGFFTYVGRALLLSLIKWLAFLLIIISIYYWLSIGESTPLRFVSIVSFYGLVMWWLSIGYLYPIMLTYPAMPVHKIAKQAFLLAFGNPFDSLLFAVINTLLLAFGFILLGPILLIIPAFCSILSLHGYWFLTGEEIPGFMEISEYERKHYSIDKSYKD